MKCSVFSFDSFELNDAQVFEVSSMIKCITPFSVEEKKRYKDTVIIPSSDNIDKKIFIYIII